MSDHRETIMKEYNVSLPVTGILHKTVEAESKEEAITKALESELTYEDIESWDTHRIICRGNVFGGELNEAYAEEA